MVRDWGAPPVLGLIGLLATLVYLRAPGYLRPAFDDSYITLTFARNLAAHGKLSFDGQTWSSGATSPLHVLIVAALIKLGAAPVFAALAVGACAQATLTSGVYVLGWAVYRSRLTATLAALLIAFTGYAAADAGNGLETSLFAALITFALASFLLLRSPRGRAVTGLLVALCILTRPEGVFLLPALLVYHWLERPIDQPMRVFLRQCAWLAGPGLLALAALLFFGLLVNGGFAGTANAKLHFFREYELPLRERIKRGSDDMGLFVGPVVTMVALAAIVRRKEMLLFALFWVPILVFYVLLFPGGLFHYYYRYQHPVMPLIAVAAAGGVVYLVRLAVANGYMGRCLIVVALFIALFPIGMQYLRWRQVYVIEARENSALVTMAADLDRIIAPDQTLATHDIGAVGYFGHFRVIDIVGLVNPGVIPYHRGRHVETYLEEKRPDYLLLFPEWDAQFLHIDAASHPDRYQLVKVYPGGELQTASYYLYRTHYP